MTDPLEQWLQSIGLERLLAVFREHEIDLEILRDLGDRDLADLGIAFGPRRKLLRRLEQTSSESGLEVLPVEAPIAGDPERRHLTVMFCDLVASSELANRLDPEDLREILRDYQDCCAEVMGRYGGHIARYIGDDLLVYFGYPQAREHDAEMAIRAGLSLVDAVSRLCPMNQNLQTRVGIAIGLVVVGEVIGRGAAQEHSVLGETPNLAARLQELASPDSVAVSGDMRRLVGGLFEYRDLGYHRFKGFERQTRAWEVVGEVAVESRFEATRAEGALSPMVGRESEVAYLEERWSQCRDNRGHVVNLSGEPGIGKSRLTEAFRLSLPEGTRTVLRYFCAPHHQSSALYPVIGQLERAAGFDREDTTDRKLHKVERLIVEAGVEVAQPAPLLASLLSIPVGDRYPPLGMSPELQKQKTFEALLEQLAGLAARNPVLVIFEDLHWVDPTTLELLQMLVSSIEKLPVLMLTTYRPEFAPPWGDAAHTSELVLARLPPKRSMSLAHQLVARELVPESVIAQIVNRSDGVPLFIEELTRSVIELGLPPQKGSAGREFEIPDTLQDSLLARLDRMPGMKAVAQVGAAIGRQFPYRLLEAVAPLEGVRLEVALELLEKSGLVYHSGVRPEAIYTFKHALVQDAAYATLLRRNLASLHGAIAEALRRLYPRVEETEPEQLAHHYSLAGDPAKAIGYHQKAAARAAQRSAYRESIEQLKRASALVEQLPDPEQRRSLELALNAALGPAYIATVGWSSPEAGDVYARSREICGELGSTPALIPVLYGLWGYHIVRAEMTTALEHAEAMLDLTLEQSDTGLIVEGEQAVGVAHLWLGNLTSARPHMERVRTLYRRDQHAALAFTFGHDPGMSALAFLAWVEWLLGYPDQAMQTCAQSIDICRDGHHPFSLAYALGCASVVEMFLGNMDGVREHAGEAIDVCREQRVGFWDAQSGIMYARATAEDNDPVETLRRIHERVGVYRSLGALAGVPYYEALALPYYAELGLWEEGLALLRRVLAEALARAEGWWVPEFRRLEGEFLLRRQKGLEAGRIGVEQPVVWSRAQQCFEAALSESAAKECRSLQLRAAISMMRLADETGVDGNARERLEQIYRSFDEGFETHDLLQARALLEAQRA